MTEKEPAKQQVFTFLFLGDRDGALLPAFKSLFDPGILFAKGKSVFYYSHAIPGSKMLMRAFAVFKQSLGMAVTPRQYSTNDAVVVVINLAEPENLDSFVPFLGEVLEKKQRCPPLIVLGLLPAGQQRKIGYFSMNALRRCLLDELGPSAAYYIEWDLGSGFNGRNAVDEIFIELAPTLHRERQLAPHERRGKIELRRAMGSVNNALPGLLEIDEIDGLRELALHERSKKERTEHLFPGYTRTHLVKRGVDPLIAKEILDTWEQPLPMTGENETLRNEIKEKIPDFIETVQKNLLPVNIYSLVSKVQMDTRVARIVLHELKRAGHDVDLHDTNRIVEELKTIMEFIVVFKGGEPLFSYLPNQDTGFGSQENISLITGMIHVLDILRSKVYTHAIHATEPVEKIRYGPLHLTIANGENVKCVVHSLEALSDDNLEKMAWYIESFETSFAGDLINYKGEADLFHDRARDLYNDIFTPLRVAHVNRDWELVEIPARQEEMLTKLQQQVRNEILNLQQEGKAASPFHLEDILPVLRQRTGISLSDLVLLLPGELLQERREK